MFFQDLSVFWYLFPSFLIAISVHEASHAGMAYVLGDPTAKIQGRLSLNPLAHLDPLGTIFLLFAGFGWAKPVPINISNFEHPKRDEALTALAGPLSNFLQALLAIALFFWGALWMPNPIQEFLKIFIHINLLLCVFNLIPLSPLDGEKVLFAFIPRKFEQYFERFSTYGPLFLFGLLGLQAFFGVSWFYDFLGYLTDKAYLLAYFFSQPFFPNIL